MERGWSRRHSARRIQRIHGIQLTCLQDNVPKGNRVTGHVGLGMEELSKL